MLNYFENLVNQILQPNYIKKLPLLKINHQV